jgi:hypothetical protein
MSSLAALDSTDVGKIGVGIIIGLVVLGALLSIIVTKIIGRLIILAVVVGLAIFVWQQRSTVEDHVNKCDWSVSFFGFDVQVPQSVKDKCGSEQ